MKKVLISTVLAGLLLSPVLALAATEGPLDGCEMTADEQTRVQDAHGVTCTLDSNDVCQFDTDDCGICCLLNTLYNVTDWIFVVLIAVAGIFVVLGAMNMIMSNGDPGKVDTGRKYIMYAFIGLILGFLARAVPSLAGLVVGS